MKFAVIVYETPAEFAARTDPARQAAYWAGYSAYSAALKEAGVAAGGAALLPPDTAVTVRAAAGPHVQDGPYADTKEQLGGFFLIDVPDREAAVAWAAKCPSSVVEVRPVLPMG